MKELFRKYREIILYVFFGGCTTLVNIVVYYAMTRFLGVGEYASNVTAWILSVLFAYVTNKIWVFESRSREAKVLLREMVSFFGCRLLSLGLDMGVLWLGIEILRMNDMLVKILSNILVIIVNYIASKFFIFKKNRQKPEMDEKSECDAE